MMTPGHFWVPRFRPYVAAGRLRVGFVAIPHRRGFHPATVIYASGYAVPAMTARRKLSIELAAYLTDSLADAVRGEAGLELPAVTAAARALVARDTLGWEAAFLRAATAGRAPWGARIERWREVEAALPDLVDRITLAGADPAAAARETARELDRVLGGRGHARAAVRPRWVGRGGRGGGVAGAWGLAVLVDCARGAAQPRGRGARGGGGGWRTRPVATRARLVRGGGGAPRGRSFRRHPDDGAGFDRSVARRRAAADPGGSGACAGDAVLARHARKDGWRRGARAR